MHIFNQSEMIEDFEYHKRVIKEIVSSIENKKRIHTVDNKIRDAKPTEFLYCYAHLTSKRLLASPLRNMFLDYFNSLETAFPTGAYIGAKMLEDDSLGSFTSHERNRSFDIFEELNNIFDKKTVQVVKSIISMGGVYRRSLWSESIESNFIIDGTTESEVSISIDQDFLRSSNRIENIDIGVTIITDSVFEKLSEIDNVIRTSVEKHIPIVLICRGFLPEVSYTLAHNYNLGKCKVIPCVIQNSEIDPFEMIDTASILGTEIIHGPIGIYDSQNLLLIGSEFINSKVSGGIIKIKSSNQMSHDLISQVIDSDLEELSNSNRLSRIMGSGINVSFPKRMDVIDRSRIKKCLALYRQWSKMGFVKFENLHFPVTNDLYQMSKRSSKDFIKKTSAFKYCIRLSDEVEKEVANS